MRRLIVSSIVCLLALGTSQVQATPIGLGDFSGSETVVDLTLLPGGSEATVIVGDLTFNSASVFIKQFVGLTETSPAGTFTVDLSTAQQRVGLALRQTHGGGPATWSIEAFDISLSLLETVFLTQTTSGSPIFGGLERTEGIARLVVTEVSPLPPPGVNYFTFISQVRIENTSTAVPEPTTIIILGLGLVGLGYARGRKGV